MDRKGRGGRAVFVKKAAAPLLAGLLAAAVCAPAYAGQWKSSDGIWYYENEDGSLAVGWQWIDGNTDGVAESYYFDPAGKLLVNTVTPDGYKVNADGAWTENGAVQERLASMPADILQAAPVPDLLSAAGSAADAAENAAKAAAEAAVSAAVGAAADAVSQGASAGPGVAGSAAKAAADAASQAVADAAQQATGEQIVEFARQFIDRLPYVYGGTSLETGSDCSGFTQAVFAHFGKTLPRTPGEQLAQGQKISASELIPGDLIFWANSSGRLYHVGIYTGPNRFVHNTNSSRGWVKEDNISDMGKDPAGYARY